MRLLLLGLLLSTVASAQTGTITGTVRDAETGETLPGAIVRVAGTRLGAAADIDGRFRIIGVPLGTHTVRFSFSGYRPLDATLTLANDVRFDANLTADPNVPDVMLLCDYSTPLVYSAPMVSRVITGEEISQLPVGR